MNLFIKKSRTVRLTAYVPNAKLLKAIVARKTDRARRQALSNVRYARHVLTTGRAPKKTLLQRIFG